MQKCLVNHNKKRPSVLYGFYTERWIGPRLFFILSWPEWGRIWPWATRVPAQEPRHLEAPAPWGPTTYEPHHLSALTRCNGNDFLHCTCDRSF